MGNNTDVYDIPKLINPGQMYNTEQILDTPIGCDPLLNTATQLFMEKNYENAMRIYITLAYKDSESNLTKEPKLHDLYTLDKLTAILTLYYNNFNKFCNSNLIEKGFITLGISQCLNNIISGTFNANDYSCIQNSGKLQKTATVFMVKAVNVLNTANFKVDFKCNNIVNYNFALYELNCGIIYQSAPGKQMEANQSIANALKRIELLCELEPCTKYVKMQSIIHEQLGNSEKALELANDALSQTGKISLENINKTKFIASKEHAEGKDLIRIY